MRLKLLAAAVVAAAVTVPAFAQAASTITQNLGPLSGTSITTFGDVLAPGASQNTYIFEFQTSAPWNALLAMQSQQFLQQTTAADPIQFELDEFIGGNWTQIAQSAYQNGAVIPPVGNIRLDPGSYRLETDQIGVPMGLTGSLDGSVTLAAVPEPATWAMLMLGLGVLGVAMRRRKEGLALAAA